MPGEVTPPQLIRPTQSGGFIKNHIPLVVGGGLVVIVGAYVIYRHIENKNAAAAGTSADSTSFTNADAAVDLQDEELAEQSELDRLYAYIESGKQPSSGKGHPLSNNAKIKKYITLLHNLWQKNGNPKVGTSKYTQLAHEAWIEAGKPKLPPNLAEQAHAGDKSSKNPKLSNRTAGNDANSAAPNEAQVAILPSNDGNGAHVVTSHGNIYPINGAIPKGGISTKLDVPRNPNNTVVDAARNDDGSISMQTANGESVMVP